MYAFNFLTSYNTIAQNGKEKYAIIEVRLQLRHVFFCFLLYFIYTGEIWKGKLYKCLFTRSAIDRKSERPQNKYK